MKEVEKVKREKTTNPFSSFITSPPGIHFETQEDKEEIILIIRRIWFTNIGWILTSLLLVILPVFLPLFISLQFLPSRFRVIGTIIWYLVLVGYILERILNWAFNVFIITDERIVDFDFYGLIYKEISDAKIEDVQDVTYQIAGFIRNLLDFGSVFIQTAAEQPQFEFKDVPQPARVAKILRELITEEEIEKIEGRVR
jgi:hypothetical protein